MTSVMKGFILAHLHFFPPRPLPFIVSAGFHWFHSIRAPSHSITYSRSSFLNEEELSLRLPMNVSPAAVDLMTICHLTDATAERNKRITRMLMQVGIPNSKSNPPYSITTRFSFSLGPSLFLELTIWLRGLLESFREVTTYQCGISEQIVISNERRCEDDCWQFPSSYRPLTVNGNDHCAPRSVFWGLDIISFSCHFPSLHGVYYLLLYCSYSSLK